MKALVFGIAIVFAAGTLLAANVAEPPGYAKVKTVTIDSVEFLDVQDAVSFDQYVALVEYNRLVLGDVSFFHYTSRLECKQLGYLFESGGTGHFSGASLPYCNKTVSSPIVSLVFGPNIPTSGVGALK